MNSLKAQETLETYTIRAPANELIEIIEWLDKHNHSIKSIKDDRGCGGGWVIYFYVKEDVNRAHRDGYNNGMNKLKNTDYIWYVNEGEGFHLVDQVFEKKIQAEKYARALFPDESEDSRYARIYCKPVVSFKEV